MSTQRKKIFISYARDDRPWVQTFATLLRDRHRFNVFIDSDSLTPGADWWQAVCDGIAQCDSAIFVMSPQSVLSSYCEAEISYARALNKPTLSIMLRPCTPPAWIERQQYLSVADARAFTQLLPLLNRRLQDMEYRHKQTSAAPVALYDHTPPPSEPLPRGSVDIQEMFDRAIDAAEVGHFEHAESLFNDVMRVDTDGRITARTRHRLLEMHSYWRIARQMETAPPTGDLLASWRIHRESFGQEFDPYHLATQFSEASGPAAHQPVAHERWEAHSPTILRNTLEAAWMFRYRGHKNADWTPYITTFCSLKIPDLPFCLVPHGTFLMGDGDRPESHIIEPYYIARYPVTNAQWARAVDAGVVGAPRRGRALKWFRSPAMANMPVVGITWPEAQIFADWLGCRLPTEREWEYAARGVDGLRYPWGDALDDHLACYERTGSGQPAQITSHPDGASWVGAQHMSGNVWEWMASMYRDGHDAAETTADDGLEDPAYVLRGGAYTGSASTLHTAHRFIGFQDQTSDDVGFRVARAL